MFQMTDMINMKSNQEDEFGQVVAGRPMLHLEDGNRYEAKMEGPAHWKIVKGQEDQQKEQNNPKVDYQDRPPHCQPHVLLEPICATSEEYSRFRKLQHSSIAMADEFTNMILFNRTINRRPLVSVPWFREATRQQTQNCIDFEIPQPLSPGESMPIYRPQQHLPMQEYHEIDADPNHVLYTPDGSYKSKIISNLLNMAALNMKYVTFLDNHHLNLPTWSELVESWKSRKVNPTLKPFDPKNSMMMWASSVDSSVLANHPIVKTALERGIVQKPSVTRNDCMHSRFDSEINMDIKYDYINFNTVKSDDNDGDDDDDGDDGDDDYDDYYD